MVTETVIFRLQIYYKGVFMENNSKYINNYKKEHYTLLKSEFKKEDAENVKAYCKDMQISVSSYIQICCKYCIDNIPLQELKDFYK